MNKSPSSFVVSIETDNAAFSDSFTNSPVRELASILRKLADRIIEYGVTDGKIQDSNGNTVGSFTTVWEQEE